MSTGTAIPSAAPGRGRMIMTIVGVLILVAMVGLWGMGVNNQLVALQENVKKAWANVESKLQRRFDLIPNLVATVKGYAEHEQTTLEEVTRLRSQWGAAKTVDEKAKAASELEGVLSRLLVVSENYPQLKADQNFLNLQAELEGTENRISVERDRYNETVTTYNTAVRQFPGSIVASFRNFKTDFPYFEAASASKEAPKVDFSKPATAQPAEK